MTTVLCDVDGVLADFMTALCNELACAAGMGHRGYTPASFEHWDMAKTLGPNSMAEVNRIMGTQGFCRGLDWYHGAKNFFAALDSSYDTYAVTAPFHGSPTWQAERATWVHAVAGVPVLSVPTDAKHLVRGDVLIEDHPGTCHRWLSTNRSGLAVLIDRPWNSPLAKEYVRHARMYRAASYPEALAIIKDLTILRACT